MNRRLRLVIAVGVLSVAGCGSQDQAEMVLASEGMDELPQANLSIPRGRNQVRDQAMLAYEHEVEIELDAGQMVARLQQAQDACNQAKFGDCVVLDVSRRAGDYPRASLKMRIVPAGVEPMIGLAGAGASLGSRSTQAEDLALVVRDNKLAQDRLRKERERLLEFQQRRDLAVADMIALSERLAETEARLELVEQEGAQHRRRIDTQLLTLEFRSPRGEAGRNEIAQAFRDFGKTLSTGTAWTIRSLAFLIPVGVVLIGLVALIRRLRRRKQARA